MFVYSANYVIGDVMPYPTCLLTLWNCLFYSDLPHTMINKAINNLHKRLNARVWPVLDILSIFMWTG